MDDAEPARVRRPIKTSARLADPDNDGDIEIATHQTLRENEHEARRLRELEKSNNPEIEQDSHSSSKRPRSLSLEHDGAPPGKKSRKKKQRANIDTERGVNMAREDLEASQATSEVIQPPPPTTIAQTTSQLPDLNGVAIQEPPIPRTASTASKVVGDSDNDSEIEEIRTVEPSKPTYVERRRDVDHFFTPTYQKGGKDVRDCRRCGKKHKRPVTLVSDVTTLRRHLQAHHEAVYHIWAKKNDFLSMLPRDTKARKEQASKDQQSRLDSHLHSIPPSERIIPYSDTIFREAAYEWMIVTDQPQEDTIACRDDQYDQVSDDEGTTPQRDEVGVIRTITVKFIKPFIDELIREEKDRKKRLKLMELYPTSKEWSRVTLLIDLLTHADNAQQAFSSDQGPSLHLAIPALESLHKAWSSRISRDKYKDFRKGLQAGLDKIEQYYDRTAESQVYTFAMLLDPSEKTEYLKKYWGDDLTKKAVDQAEEMYKARYIEMYGSGSAPVIDRIHHSKRSKLNGLLRELSDDEDDVGSLPTPSVPVNQEKPWLEGFKKYLHSTDVLGDLTIVRWWGLNAARYPVWASLA
ncbi:hypothetical protein H0H93_008099, partial [Arthromyces matolae]